MLAGKMVRSVVAILAATVMLLVSSVAMAASVRLHNKDRTTYKLYVKHSSSAVHTTINGRTVTNICSTACTIRLVDTGSVLQAKPGDRLVIKDGKLVRRSK